MNAVVAALITLIVGPVMFTVIGVFMTSNLPRFPLGVVDGVGDIVFLPVFNAVAVSQNGFPYSFDVWAYSAVVSAVLTSAVTIQTVYYQRRDEWSRPSMGTWNVGTWYHAMFVLVQLTVVIVAVSRLPEDAALWSALTGYLVTAVYSLWREHGLV